jgi:hypothetical protein
LTGRDAAVAGDGCADRFGIALMTQIFINCGLIASRIQRLRDSPVCSGIRAKNINKFGMDRLGRKPLHREKPADSSLIQRWGCERLTSSLFFTKQN